MLGQELKEQKKSNQKLYLVINLIYCFILSYIILDYAAIINLFFGEHLPVEHFSALIIPVLSIFILIILLENFFSQKIFKVLFFTVLLVVVITLLPEFIHTAIFHTSIDYMSLMTFADTNKSETSDFINTYGSFSVYIKLFIMIILPFIFLKFMPYYDYKIHLKSLKFILMFFIFIISFILTIPRDYVLREIKQVYIFNTYNQVLIDKQAFIENIKNHKFSNSFGEIKDLSGSDNNTYIIVIGESADRNRYSLYNYKRDTSPYLSNIKDELYIFDDIISPHAHTSPALEKILTFADFRNEDLKYKYGSMIDFFNSAGFKTYWLSNQYKYGTYDAGYSVIANAAVEQKYINTNSWQSNKTNYYDEKLVEELETVLKNNNGSKFIVLHFFGSHSPYAQRYPEKFNIYKSDSFLKNINPSSNYANVLNYNAYDNSILYTDYVLNEIIKLLKKENINGYMLYFSDHGEDAGTTDKNTFYGHNESISTKPMYEIPFILWLSETYKSENKEKVNAIQKSIHRPYQTDRLIHTIIDLSNLENNLFKPEDSIINEKYQAEKRLYGNKEYTK